MLDAMRSHWPEVLTLVLGLGLGLGTAWACVKDETWWLAGTGAGTVLSVILWICLPNPTRLTDRNDGGRPTP
mgnify:CR=1 FL=1